MDQRSKISKKNPYFLERYRYLELKNFCLQYPIWKLASDHLKSLSDNRSWILAEKERGCMSDPVSKAVESAMQYDTWIKMVDDAMDRIDISVREPMLICVTKGLSYDTINASHFIPCSRTNFYKEYRKFFCILNKIRN